MQKNNIFIEPEYLEVLNFRGEKTGRIIRRNIDDLEEGEYVPIVVVWIQNNKGEFLLQKTSCVNKSGKIAVTGGCVVIDQTPIDAAMAEVREELGLIIYPHELQFVGNFTAMKKHYFYVYYVKVDFEINQLTLSTREVDSVAWYSCKEIENLYRLNIDDVRETTVVSYGLVKEFLHIK